MSRAFLVTRRSNTQGADARPFNANSSLNALFIGNSFTARNDLPGLIAMLAEAGRQRLDHRLISAGGASLRMHWNKGEALRAIQGGGYDHVVLQEQSTLPIKNAKRFHENVRLFDQAIRSAGSKTALYMTWARKHTPQAQDAITDAYNAIGRELDATVVPVGAVWRRFLREHPGVPLHDEDQSHPTLAGSYLAACVFYGVLFGQSPVGIEAGVEGLSREDVERLERAAWPLPSHDGA
jgi:hypothetical protein